SSDRDTPSSCTAVAEPRCDHEIYKINATGTGLTRLTNHAGEDSHPVFSPDGHKIAWEGEGPQHIEFNRQHDLFVMNTNGTQQTNITDASRPNSPDFNNQGSADALNRLYIRPDWQPLQTVPPAMPAPAMRVFIDNVNMRSGDAANTGTIYLSARAPAGGT